MDNGVDVPGPDNLTNVPILRHIVVDSQWFWLCEGTNARHILHIAIRLLEY